MNTADHIKLKDIVKKLTGRDEDLTPSQAIAAISDHVEGKNQDSSGGGDVDSAGNPVPAQTTQDTPAQ